MEIWGMIAVGFFTLGGVILTNIFQQRTMEAQRKNLLDDEARKFKRELVGSRLEKSEEQIKLMAIVISEEIDNIIGNPPLSGGIDVTDLRKRIELNNSEAWTAVRLVDSQKLRENYDFINSIYWDFIRNGSLTQEPDEWHKLTKAEIEAINIMDNLRAFGNEDGI